MPLDIRSHPTAEDTAVAAARHIAALAAAAGDDAESVCIALSGGSTPWIMLDRLLDEDVPWDRLHVCQVDERAAPDGHEDRNMTRLQAILADSELGADQVHGMPVDGLELGEAASRYADRLEKLAGHPPVLDLVHLGLGEDGHTASLIPGDPVLSIEDRDVAETDPYQGRRRLSLTYPVINRARHRMWIVTGAGKADMLVRLRDADPTIPAGRVNQDNAIVFADEAACAKL